MSDKKKKISRSGVELFGRYDAQKRGSFDVNAGFVQCQVFWSRYSARCWRVNFEIGILGKWAGFIVCFRSCFLIAEKGLGGNCCSIALHSYIVFNPLIILYIK